MLVKTGWSRVTVVFHCVMNHEAGAGGKPLIEAVGTWGMLESSPLMGQWRYWGLRSTSILSDRGDGSYTAGFFLFSTGF